MDRYLAIPRMEDARPQIQENAPTNVHEHGLTLLHEPDDQPLIADIIFVHGLQGHPRKTWHFGNEDDTAELYRHTLARGLFGKRAKDPSPSRSKPDSSIYWPKDLLPKDQDNVRILTYGYDSRISHFFSGPANQLNISQHGEALLNRVSGERTRSKCRGRPIIFVAHSLGGLLVKEALNESRKQSQTGKDDLYASTRAVIFFGTPHLGSDDAKWGLLLSSIANAAFNTNDKILRGLKPDNEKLDNWARNFQDVLDTGKLRVCSLQESAGKTGLSIFNGKVRTDFPSHNIPDGKMRIDELYFQRYLPIRRRFCNILI